MIDVLRASIKFNNAKQYLALCSRLDRGWEVDVNGERARLTIARLKNNFDFDTNPNPCHFRRIGLNMELAYGVCSHFVEIQARPRLYHRPFELTVLASL